MVVCYVDDSVITGDIERLSKEWTASSRTLAPFGRQSAKGFWLLWMWNVERLPTQLGTSVRMADQANQMCEGFAG